MPRMNQQKARGSMICTVVVPPSWEGGKPSTCGKSARAHGPNVKRVIDHKFGGLDGHYTVTTYPECGVCHRQIVKGEEYRFWQPRHGPRFTRCLTCPPPARSMLTGSEILSMAWDIADDPVDVPDDATLEDVESMRDDFAERIQEVVDLIQEKLDAIESGMGHTGVPVYEELEERKGGYESWQQEVESLDFDTVEGEACAECGLSETDCGASDDDHEFSAEQGLDVEAARDALSEALGQCPE